MSRFLERAASGIMAARFRASESTTILIMRDFYLYNTLSRNLEKLTPRHPPEVGYYSCGPTVYHHAHIGNMRTYVFTDTVRRALLHAGYRVRHVMNITDVGHMTTDEDEGEDKMLVASSREKKTPWEIADHYTALFLTDLDALNIQRPEILCKATEHIPEMVKLTSRLVEREMAYVTPSAVYFDTVAFPDYGKLARLDLDAQEAGARIEPHPDKRNPSDFALWKLAQPHHIMQWDSPWGRGYPGWHIECSAMAMHYLGETFDLHSGGIDHIPVHHENEIAQSEGATGKPFATIWLHANFLNIGDTKISKSLGNFLILSDLAARGIPPLAFRLFCFTGKYRQPLNFTDDSLRAAQKTLQGIHDFVRHAPDLALEGEESFVAPLRERFDEAVCNDLNLPVALAVTLELIHLAHRHAAPRILSALFQFDEVLGLDLKRVREEGEEVPTPVRALVTEREGARRNKEWSRADALREEIAGEGYAVEDTAQGVRVKKRIPE